MTTTYIQNQRCRCPRYYKTQTGKKQFEKQHCRDRLVPVWSSLTTLLILLLGTTTMMTQRHVGHEDRDVSHMSTQLAWNTWLHCGKTLILSPCANAARQIGHSSESCFNPGLIFTIGKESRIFFFSGGGAGGSERLSHACRTTRATPVKTHTRKKKKAAKTRSNSVFTVVEGPGGGIGAREEGDEAFIIRPVIVCKWELFVVDVVVLFEGCNL